MNIEPIPPIYEPTYRKPHFGIYIKTDKTAYGCRDVGLFKGKNIDIYHDYGTKSKLIYISDLLRNWIKSKFIYFADGKRKVVKSEAHH